MYNIVLKNGKNINIKASEVEWCERTRTIRFINNREVVARINMDNIVGWINADYQAGPAIGMASLHMIDNR